MSARRTRKDDGSQWTVADSRSVYGIRHWGAGYFAINDKGRVEVRPNGPESQPIDLFEQVEDDPLDVPVGDHIALANEHARKRRLGSGEALEAAA